MAGKIQRHRKPPALLGLVGIMLALFWAGGVFASQEAEILLARGNKLYIDGDYIQARQELQQAAALDPTNPEIRVLLGLTYFAVKDYAQARDEFHEALRLDPNVPRGKLYLGATYFYLGRYTDSERWLKEARAQNPRDALALYYLGLVAAHQSRTTEAQSHIDNAALLAPEYLGPFQVYRQGLVGAGRFARDKFLSLGFYTGLEYDDNFKILPDQVTLPTVGPLGGSKGTWRVPIVLEANIRPFRRDNWEAGVDYFFYSGINFATSEFNFLTNRADFFVQYTNGPFRVRPWYGIDVALKALERYSLFNTAGLALGWQPLAETSTDLIYRFQNRSFRYPTVPDYKRTGYENQVGLFQTFYFGNQAAWRVGGVFTREITEGVNWSNNNFGVITDGTLNLPYKLNLWGLFQYKRYNFDNVDTFALVRQRQNYYQVSLQLRRQLTDYLDLIGGYTHITQRSNIPDFTYERNIYQLLLYARY